MQKSHAFFRTSIHAVRWAVLCCISGTGCAAASSCNAQALNSPGCAHALESVRNLPELAAWYSTHNFPVAFGESLDKQERLDGRCYWSVSVYANQPERLELWHIFYVEADGKRLMVQDPVSGDAISSQKWRSKANKSQMA